MKIMNKPGNISKKIIRKLIEVLENLKKSLKDKEIVDVEIGRAHV